MRTRFLQRPNRSEGPCVEACRIEELRNHKVPPAYSRAEESARSLYGRRDDDLSKFIGSRALTHTLTACFTQLPTFATSMAHIPGFFAGIEMSIGVTLPNVLRLRSNSLSFPTTRMESLSGWTYFLATRSTSAGVTFSMPARKRSRKSGA